MSRLNMLLLLPLSALCSMTMAQEVTVETAKGRVADFLSSQSAGPKHAKGTASSSDLKLAYTSKSEGKTCFYVFNVGDDDGFVIAGGDEVAHEILGYSTCGTFDYDSAPDNFRWWLSQYTKQITCAASSGVVRKAKAAVERESIEPLLKTLWNQTYPFNNMMPCLPDNPDSHYYTGCVATAMAQVMNYYQYPERGTGELSYTNSDGSETYSANFGATIYDWDNMIDDYGIWETQEQVDAVATLMYHAAVSVYMSYNRYASSAYHIDAGSALARYFGYDKSIRYEEQQYFSNEEWEELIYNELKEKRPVLFGAHDSQNGHSFVCDGYRDGGFHFNWGWGAENNTYFHLSATDNDGKLIPYCYEQAIIRNIFPDKGGTAMGHLAISSPLFGGDPLYLEVDDTVYNDNYDYDCSSNEKTSFRLCGHFSHLACVRANKTYFGESLVTHELGVKATDKTTGLTYLWPVTGRVYFTGVSEYTPSTVGYIDFDPKDLEFNGTYTLEPLYRIEGQNHEDWQVADILNTETLPTITVSGAKDPRPNVLAFSIESSSMHEDGSVKIHWPDDYEGTISFASGDERIATVDADGTIRGLSEGKVDITACGSTTSTYCGCTQTFTITVIGDPKDIYFVEAPHFNNDNNPYSQDMELHYKIANNTGYYQTFNLHGDIEGTDNEIFSWCSIADGDIYDSSLFFDDYNLIPGHEYTINLYREFLSEDYAEVPARKEVVSAEGDEDEYPEDEPVYIPMNYPSITFTYRDKLALNYGVSPAGYGTLILPFNADVPEGMTVYSCTEVDANGVLNLQEESSIVRNVPYIVKATYGESYKFVGPEAIDADKPSFEKGILVGAVADNVPLQKNTDYILQIQDGVAAFYRYTGTPSENSSENDAEGNRLVKQFRAFLRLPAATNVPKLSFPGDGDEPEGITTLTAGTPLPSGIYSIDGKRQTNFQKGLNILILDDGTVRKVFVR